MRVKYSHYRALLYVRGRTLDCGNLGPGNRGPYEQIHSTFNKYVMFCRHTSVCFTISLLPQDVVDAEKSVFYLLLKMFANSNNNHLKTCTRMLVLKVSYYFCIRIFFICLFLHFGPILLVIVLNLFVTLPCYIYCVVYVQTCCNGEF